MMHLYEGGKEYWTIVRRYRQHKADNPIMEKVAVRDMRRLLDKNPLPSIAKRANQFISVHQKHSPSGFDPGSGPRYA
jgi:hypothetical protein